MLLPLLLRLHLHLRLWESSLRKRLEEELLLLLLLLLLVVPSL